MPHLITEEIEHLCSQEDAKLEGNAIVATEPNNPFLVAIPYLTPIPARLANSLRHYSETKNT